MVSTNTPTQVASTRSAFLNPKQQESDSRIPRQKLKTMASMPTEYSDFLDGSALITTPENPEV